MEEHDVAVLEQREHEVVRPERKHLVIRPSPGDRIDRYERGVVQPALDGGREKIIRIPNARIAEGNREPGQSGVVSFCRFQC